MNSSDTSSDGVDLNEQEEFFRTLMEFEVDEYFMRGHCCYCGKRPTADVQAAGLHKGRRFWRCGHKGNSCSYIEWQDDWMCKRLIHILQEIYALNNKIKEVIVESVSLHVENSRLKSNVESATAKLDKVKSTLWWSICGGIVILGLAWVYFRAFVTV